MQVSMAQHLHHSLVAEAGGRWSNLRVSFGDRTEDRGGDNSFLRLWGGDVIGLGHKEELKRVK